MDGAMVLVAVTTMSAKNSSENPSMNEYLNCNGELGKIEKKWQVLRPPGS